MRPEPSGVWNLTAGSESLVPQSVRGVISRRLARLNHAAREILAVASVSGREFEFGVVGDVVERRGIGDRSDVAVVNRGLIKIYPLSIERLSRLGSKVIFRYFPA